jgi:O-antigen/teichoic acid export membrane protein
MDVMMVAQMVGLSATGVFSTIVFLASALQVPYKSLIRIASPLVSDYWKQREFTKMTELYRKVSSVSLVIGFGMFILIWVNIDFFFTFLKPEFNSGIWVFFFLMMGRLVDMYFGLNGAIFTTSKKYKYDIYFTLFLIVAVFVLNLIMIPIWGITGAAISTSIAMIVYNIGRIIFVWKAYKIHPFHKNQLVVIALGICAIIAGELTSELIDNKWLQFIFESVLAFIIFFLPIYLFSLEPELKNYVQKGSDFLLKKVKNSAKK